MTTADGGRRAANDVAVRIVVKTFNQSCTALAHAATGRPDNRGRRPVAEQGMSAWASLARRVAPPMIIAAATSEDKVLFIEAVPLVAVGSDRAVKS